VNKLKICVYAICKNEEKFVDRWMDSMSEADLIVVTDTGSTDGTVERLCERGAIVYVDKVLPWRFDVARNISLEHVPQDVDVCVCTDLDELFVAGWRQNIEDFWTPDAKAGKYLYNWSLKEDGSPDVQLKYLKIHARQDFRWTYPIHEIVIYIGKEPYVIVELDKILLNHYPDRSKSRASYLPLLEIAAQEMPDDDRVNYYLGKEYLFRGEWQKCIDTQTRYLSLPSALWNEERCAAMRCIAQSNHYLGNNKEAYTWFYRAIAEAPYLRDAYVEFAKAGYELCDWPLVFFMIEEALKINVKSDTYINMGYSWDQTPHDLGAISCYHLGMYKRSLTHATTAIAICPQDVRLKNNLQLIMKRIDDWIDDSGVTHQNY